MMSRPAGKARSKAADHPRESGARRAFQMGWLARPLPLSSGSALPKGTLIPEVRSRGKGLVAEWSGPAKALRRQHGHDALPRLRARLSGHGCRHAHRLRAGRHGAAAVTVARLPADL